MPKDINEEANKLFKTAPSFRGGIVMGLYLVRDSLQLTDKQIGEINKAVDIISGVQRYKKPAPRPAEINKLDAVESEAVITSKPDANKLPRRAEDSLDLPPEQEKPFIGVDPAAGPDEDKAVIQDPPKKKIRRPWEKKPNTIRRPKR